MLAFFSSFVMFFFFFFFSFLLDPHLSFLAETTPNFNGVWEISL